MVRLSSGGTVFQLFFKFQGTEKCFRENGLGIMEVKELADKSMDCKKCTRLKKDCSFHLVYHLRLFELQTVLITHVS